MRQEQIRKTPRRKPRRVEPPALILTPAAPAARDADELLDRIDRVLGSQS